MKKLDITSILREIVTEDQDKLRAGHLGTLRGSLLHLKTLVKAEKPYEQILDYIDRVIEQTKSSDPLSEEANNIFNKAELIDYLGNLESSTRVSIPKIEGKGFSPSVGQQSLVGEALDTLEKTHLDGEFKLYMDNPTFKRFSLIQSPESTKSHEKLVQSFGTED
jgi:hypothetical protein